MSGRHGYDCKGTCGHCRDGSVCNDVTGNCQSTTCDKGWTGYPVCKTSMILS